MPKVAVTGYRLPITADTEAVIEDQQARVRSAYPHSDHGRLPLFPAPHHNPVPCHTGDGYRPVATWRKTLPWRGGRAPEQAEALGGEVRSGMKVQASPTAWSPAVRRQTRVARPDLAGRAADVRDRRDGTVLTVIGGELNAKVHADRALEFLRARR